MSRMVYRDESDDDKLEITETTETAQEGVNIPDDEYGE